MVHALVERAVRRGALPTYHIAFVLVDDLVRPVGFGSFRAYFGSFRGSTDAAAMAFEQA